MAEKVEMPQLSDTMETGLIVEWKVEEGDKVEVGDVLAEVETDKATMDLEAFTDGLILKKLVPEGGEVPTQEVVAIIGEEGEDISELLASIEAEDSESMEPEGTESEQTTEPESDSRTETDAESAVPETTSSAEPESDQPAVAGGTTKETVVESDAQVGEEGRLRVSPVARRMAEENGVDLSRITGSGSEGRIIKRDVEEKIQQDEAGQPGGTAEPVQASQLKSEKVKLSPMRKAIARRMSQANQEIPHFHLQAEINAERIVDVREDFASVDQELSFNDFILLAATRALTQVPRLNASYEEEFLQKYDHVDLAFAVSTEAGLITPVLREADQKSILEIHRESRQLVEKVRSGEITPEEYQGGTFTVSNLGMFGIKNFSAVINPPQVAILAVGAVEDRPVVRNGEVVPGKQLEVTLSCDHRAVDGAAGARYLQELTRLIERPALLLG